MNLFVGDEWDLDKARKGRSKFIEPSPDGQKFFFITQRGDLECDCNVYELSVYSVEDVIRALKSSRPSDVERGLAPIATITMRNKMQAIQQAAWVVGEDDIEKDVIEFRGMTPDSMLVDGVGHSSLYRFHVRTKRLETVIDVPLSQRIVGYVRGGSNVVYTLQDRGPDTSTSKYPVYALTPRITEGMVLREGKYPTYEYQTYAVQAGRPAWRLRSQYVEAADRPWFSPDRKWAIAIRQPERPSASWSRYDGSVSSPSGVSAHGFPQFMILDFDHATEDPMLDAPTGVATQMGADLVERDLYNRSQAFWGKDSRHVLLTNAALPLQEGTPHARMPYLIAYDIATRKWDALEPYRTDAGETIESVSWQKLGEQILVEHRRGEQRTAGARYTLGHSGWKRSVVEASVKQLEPVKRLAFQSDPSDNVDVPLAGGVIVEEREGANEPSHVVASLKGRTLELMGPDPAIQGVWLAPTHPLKWKDSEGTAQESGLILPRALPSGDEKLPLVIQAGAYQPTMFRPDGPTRTAHAAQSLAARNIAVLNMDVPISADGTRADREIALFIDWVESAATAAAKTYPIDLQRIGLVGFSRTGYEVRYMITNPRSLRPAAAVIADSAPGSYPLTLAGYAMGTRFANEYDSIYGGPFVHAKRSWFEREVTFNVDRVRTPVLFANNSESLGFYLDTIGAFRANRKAFDFLIFPNGTHQLSAPLQRAASIDATADWMAFWLLGKEDSSSPDKAERFAHWRELRQLHEQDLGTH